MNKSDLKNGMIVTLRSGVERVLVGEYFVEESYADVDCTNLLYNYNDDLTYINNCTSEDIMKIEYGGKVIWERGAEWDKVPFGTKVKVWDDDDDDEEDKLVGRFIYYNEDYEFPFLVFVENEKDTSWFRYCEIIEEEDE